VNLQEWSKESTKNSLLYGLENQYRKEVLVLREFKFLGAPYWGCQVDSPDADWLVAGIEGGGLTPEKALVSAVMRLEELRAQFPEHRLGKLLREVTKLVGEEVMREVAWRKAKE